MKIIEQFESDLTRLNKWADTPCVWMTYNPLGIIFSVECDIDIISFFLYRYSINRRITEIVFHFPLLCRDQLVTNQGTISLSLFMGSLCCYFYFPILRQCILIGIALL